MADDTGNIIKDWATPIIGFVGLFIGWVGSGFGAVAKLQTRLTEIAARQEAILERLDALEQRNAALDEHGSRALGAALEKIDGLKESIRELKTRLRWTLNGQNNTEA
jgi:hypothetical protein